MTSMMPHKKCIKVSTCPQRPCQGLLPQSYVKIHRIEISIGATTLSGRLLCRSPMPLKPQALWTASRWNDPGVLPGQSSTAVCVNPANPIHCKTEGEWCTSKRTSECLPPLECPVELGAQGCCTRPNDFAPCGEPPVHCKPNCAACALARVSECIDGNHCDRLMGICVAGKAPKKPFGRRLSMVWWAVERIPHQSRRIKGTDMCGMRAVELRPVASAGADAAVYYMICCTGLAVMLWRIWFHDVVPPVASLMCSQ